MTTLNDLNNFSDGTVSFTENRPSFVYYNFPNATDLTEQPITSQSFTLQRTIDIVEIIKPQQALIVFEVDVSALSGTTVSFGSLPAGVTAADSNGVYTVSGIDSVSDWEAVRAPTITLPSADHQGAFSYTCKIMATVDGVRETKQWTVGTFKLLASLSATSTFSFTSEPLIKGAECHMIVAIDVTEADFEFAILARFSVDATITRIFQLPTPNINVVASLTEFNDFTNLNNLTYQSNIANGYYDAGNGLFYGGIFSQCSYNDTRQTHNHLLEFTVSSGYITNPDDPNFGTADAANTNAILSNTTTMEDSSYITLTGYLKKIQYWPDYNNTSTVQLTVKKYFNGVLEDQFKTPIAHSTAGQINNPLRTFNTVGTTTFTVPVEEVLYGDFSVLLVGGGGGGINQSGGGGGAVLTQNPTSTIASNINSRDFSITVGGGGGKREINGGAIGTNGVTFFAYTGGSSQAFGFTANGGTGGKFYYQLTGSTGSHTSTWDHRGGTSGNGNLGYSAYPISGTQGGQLNVSSFGGGGGGAGGAATNQFGLGGAGLSPNSPFSGTFGQGGNGYGQSPYTGSVSAGYDPTNYGEGGSYGFRNGGANAPSSGFQGLVQLKVEPK
tara:strand:+ start:567 stop:2399 length:1833 start_codon:yes stop_codon:yes gene_type:complete